MALNKDKKEKAEQQNNQPGAEELLEAAQQPAQPEAAPPGEPEPQQPEPQQPEPQQPEPQQPEPQQPPTPEQLLQAAAQRLAALKKELKEAEDRNLRLMAEFDNFRRRTQKERESIYPDAVADTIKVLLPVLDNFQRAMEAPCTDEEYRKGVEMTYKGLMEALQQKGLAEFAQAGEPFDPQLHNAVMHIEDEKLAKNVISQVYQRGYKIGESVLRYAMVQTAN